MAVDFPNNPVDQQVFEAEGSTWVYEEFPGCWRPTSGSDLDEKYVLTAGDTMTGALSAPDYFAIAQSSSDSPSFNLTNEASYTRWSMGMYSTDSGEDFYIGEYDGAGGWIGAPITIEGGTHHVTMTGPLTAYSLYANAGADNTAPTTNYAQMYYDNNVGMSVLKGAHADGDQYYTFGVKANARNDRIMRQLDADARYLKLTGDTMLGRSYYSADIQMNAAVSNAAYSHTTYQYTNFGYSGAIQATHISGAWVGPRLVAVQNSREFSFRGDGVGYSVGGWLTSSDSALKADLQPLSEAIGMPALDALAGVTTGYYRRTDGLNYDGSPIMNAGLFADTLPDEIKTLVHRKGDPRPGATPEEPEGEPYEQDIYGYEYGAVMSVMIDAIKELTARIEELEGKSNG